MGIFDDLASIGEDVVDGAAGMVRGLVAAGAGLFEGSRGLAGIAVAAGSLFVVGPGAVVPAFLAGSAAGGALVRHRHMTSGERATVDRVFAGTLPANDRIVLTNLTGLGGRKFVCPTVGGQILVNLGPVAFSTPTTYEDTAYPGAGKLFVHELTHVWQFHHATFPAGLLCEGIGTQLAGADYRPGEGGRPWGHYNLEQQATIVDEWYRPSARGPRGVPVPAMAPAHPFSAYVTRDLRRRVLPQHEAHGLEFVLQHGVGSAPDRQDAWRYCGKCRGLFYAGDQADQGGCPSGGPHQAHGFDFALRHGIGPAATRQASWRYCGKCRNLFYNGDAQKKGPCAMGGQHTAHGWDFAIEHLPAAPSHHQPAWRYCGSCRALFYNGDPRDRGRCAGGGSHSPVGLDYLLHHGRPGTGEQSSWRYCGKCRTLFYAGDPAHSGSCPAGGSHSAHGLVFALDHGRPDRRGGQPGWRYCGRCRALVYEPAGGGRCADGGEHVVHGLKFTLAHRPALARQQQADWRYCGRCRVLFYAGDPAHQGRCAWL